jgi:hypothetical protein
VRLSPLGTSASTWPIVPAPDDDDDDDDECEAVGGMRIGRENGRVRRKPAPVPHCPPQIPHDLTILCKENILSLYMFLSRSQ